MRFREFMLEAEPARKIPFQIFDVETKNFKPVPGVTIKAGTKDARIMNFIQNNPNLSPQARNLAYSRMNPANINIPEPKGWVAKFGRWFQNNIGKLGGKVSPLARIPGLNLVANSKALNAGEDAEIEFQRNLWKTDPNTYKELYPKGDIAAGPNTPGWQKLTPGQTSPETRTYSNGQAADKDLPNLPVGTTAIIGGKKYIITDPSNKLSNGKKAWTRDYDDSDLITNPQPQSKPKTEPGDDLDIITKTKPQTKPSTQPGDPEVITQPRPRTKPKTNPDELPFIPKPKPEVKPQTKPEVKPQTKPEVKPQTKPEVKPQQQPRTQQQQKPRTQPQQKPRTQPQQKPRTQPQQKPRTQPQQKPRTQRPARPLRPVPPMPVTPNMPTQTGTSVDDYIYTRGSKRPATSVKRLR